MIEISSLTTIFMKLHLTFTETKVLRRNTWSVIDKSFMAFLVADYGQKLFKSAASSLPKTNVNSDTPPLNSEFTIQ